VLIFLKIYTDLLELFEKFIFGCGGFVQDREDFMVGDVFIQEICQAFWVHLLLKVLLKQRRRRKL